MSSVRLCDGCGELFSENVEGWATQSATITKRDDNGRPVAVSAQLDKCPVCVEIEMNRSNISIQNRTMLTAQPHYTKTDED